MDKQAETMILQLAEVMSLYDLEWQMVADMAELLPQGISRQFLDRALGE